MNKSYKNKKYNDKALIFLKTQILLVILYSIFLLFSSIVLLKFNNISTNYYFYIISFSFSFSNFVGGFYSAKKNGKNGMLTALLCCLPISVFMLFVSLLFNGFIADYTSIVYFVIVIIGAMLGGITSVNAR